MERTATIYRLSSAVDPFRRIRPLNKVTGPHDRFGSIDWNSRRNFAPHQKKTRMAETVTRSGHTCSKKRPATHSGVISTSRRNSTLFEGRIGPVTLLDGSFTSVGAAGYSFLRQLRQHMMSRQLQSSKHTTQSGEPGTAAAKRGCPLFPGREGCRERQGTSQQPDNLADRSPMQNI